MIWPASSLSGFPSSGSTSSVSGSRGSSTLRKTGKPKMRKPSRKRWGFGIGACGGLLFLAVSCPFWAQAAGASFNGGRAYEDLKHLASYGPRPSGSKALADARRWMISELKQTGAQVQEDTFTASTPAGMI